MKIEVDKPLEDKKMIIDYARMIKEATSSLYPVSPRKLSNVATAFVIGLMIFAFLQTQMGTAMNF